MTENARRYEIACDQAWSALNDADHRQPDDQPNVDEWKHHIGPLREALRKLEADAPDAEGLIGWVQARIEIYAGHAGFRAQNELTVESGYRFGARHVAGPSELDTGVMHGPAGRDIEWGCHKMPRYDD